MLDEMSKAGLDGDCHSIVEAMILPLAEQLADPARGGPDEAARAYRAMRDAQRRKADADARLATLTEKIRAAEARVAEARAAAESDGSDG